MLLKTLQITVLGSIQRRQGEEDPRNGRAGQRLCGGRGPTRAESDTPTGEPPTKTSLVFDFFHFMAIFQKFTFKNLAI